MNKFTTVALMPGKRSNHLTPGVPGIIYVGNAVRAAIMIMYIYRYEVSD